VDGFELQRPTWAEIDLGALRRNFAVLRARAGGRRVIGVVKANGYGHGAVAVSRTLCESGCDALAVATLEEGLELRRAGLERPVLLLQGLHAAAQADPALGAGFAVVVHGDHGLAALEAAARRAGRRFGVHLKVDTGMGRLGVLPEELDAWLDRILASSGLEVQGLMTHFAEGDDRTSLATEQQRRRFAGVLARVRARGIEPAWIHADHSAGVLRGPTPGTNAVRPGLSLYGADPTLEGDQRLEAVMTVRASVLATKLVPAGSRVGYGGTHVAARPTRLAILAIGYGDGLPRAAGGRFSVGIGAVRAPLVGRVSMDLAAVDVGELAVQPGAEALIFGRSDALEIRVEELAAASDRIPYEILVGIGARLPRVLVDRTAARR
jgi:alanine racemase